MRWLIWIIVISFLAMVLLRCAQPGNPGGGPRDTKPPEVIKTEPENRSANFNSKKIIITFDEYIELDNITQKALISPPMGKLPDFKLRGKSLQIRFNEPLKDSTTYSIYFADAIVDLTERNPILNYTYIFSTGTKVDSLSVFGKIYNAFDLKPPESVFILLYKDNNDTLPIDSLPLNVIPYYVSKTTENGNFQFNGLGDDDYLMFGLKDLNANYYYDQPGEDIAFLDSLINPFYAELLDLDSLRADSTRFIVSDSIDVTEAELIRDSLIHEYVHEYEASFPQYELAMFNEVDSTQRLINATVSRKNNIEFYFAWPATNIDMIPINFNADTTWFIEEVSISNDTIWWFLKDLPVDTLEVLVSQNGDTLEYVYLKLDPAKNNPALSRRQQKKEDEQPEYLEINTMFKGGVVKLDQPPEIMFYHPINEVLNDSILLIAAGDTMFSPSFLFMDSSKRRIQYPITLEEDTRYSLIFPDSCFIDWNGNYNEKKEVRFRTKSLRDYGVLVLTIDTEFEQSYIFQLMNEKEDVLQSYYFSSDTTIAIQYLEPATYLLKLIYDDNGNKQWDSGNFRYKIQPEKVLINTKKIQVRANWDIEEEWVLDENARD